MLHLGSLDGGTLGGSSGEGRSSIGEGTVTTFGFGISLGGGGDIFSVLLHNVILLLLLFELLLWLGKSGSFLFLCLAIRAWLGLGALGVRLTLVLRGFRI